MLFFVQNASLVIMDLNSNIFVFFPLSNSSWPPWSCWMAQCTQQQFLILELAPRIFNAIPTLMISWMLEFLRWTWCWIGSWRKISKHHWRFYTGIISYQFYKNRAHKKLFTPIHETPLLALDTRFYDCFSLIAYTGGPNDYFASLMFILVKFIIIFFQMGKKSIFKKVGFFHRRVYKQHNTYTGRPLIFHLRKR